MRCTSIIALTLLCASCASETRLARPTRAAISARHTGKTVALRQSCYYGDLYDENTMWMLSAYPFAETSDIADTKGAPIHPQGQRGILTAGTTFLVEQVEFPDSIALNKRMLTTPRYNPWVYLKPAEQLAVAAGRKHFILLLPRNLDTEAGVEAAMTKLLGPPDEVKGWLASRRPTVRVAIENKDIVPGMTLDELTAAMGPPHRWFNETKADGTFVEAAWYPKIEAWFVNKVVTETHPGRPFDEYATKPTAVSAAASKSASPKPAASKPGDSKHTEPAR